MVVGKIKAEYKVLLLIGIFIFIQVSGYGQKETISGKITDKNDGSPMPTVNILINEKTGITSDMDGNFSYTTEDKSVKFIFSFIGYETLEVTYQVKHGASNILNISMNPDVRLLDEVVVSAGKFDQKLSDLTITAVIMKPAQIMNQNVASVEAGINRVPGVDISDSQPSIRGGSGYSYGAGSRVLVLLDDLPILSADAGDVKWDFIPVENVGQVEILKGATSVLYGSSALNGIINFRTEPPTTTPKTKFDIYNGICGDPARKELIWWEGSRPVSAGMNFSHTRKIKNVDMTFGGHLLDDTGYRENAFNEKVRITGNTKVHSKMVEGLNYGLSANYMKSNKADFFLWQDADSGAWRQNIESVSKLTATRYNIDPFVNYTKKNGNRHKLNNRYFFVGNSFPDAPDKNNHSDIYYSEYQFQRPTRKDISKGVFTIGVVGTYSTVISNLYGNHNGSNLATFTQLDIKIGEFSLSAGFRAEYFRTDDSQTVYIIRNVMLPFQPVFRAGLNYKLAEYTFLRSSYGQGYRFPSIAEKYIQTNLGSLRIFPNPELQPEKGWNSEIGIKQGIGLGSWKGFIDMAAFYTRYSNMMEFTFGIYKPDSVPYPTLEHVGFKSINVGQAEIYGVDLMLMATGKILGLPIEFSVGYTYTYPKDITDTLHTYYSEILKYRYFHSFKSGLEVRHKKFSTGISFIYRSFMINIDKSLEEPLITGYEASAILPGLKTYREEHNTGYYFLDWRISYKMTDNSQIIFEVNNLLNDEYMIRPGDIAPPRNLAIRYSLKM